MVLYAKVAYLIAYYVAQEILAINVTKVISILRLNVLKNVMFPILIEYLMVNVLSVANHVLNVHASAIKS